MPAQFRRSNAAPSSAGSVRAEQPTIAVADLHLTPLRALIAHSRLDRVTKHGRRLAEIRLDDRVIQDLDGDPCDVPAEVEHGDSSQIGRTSDIMLTTTR